jgi:hypothetical protein
MQAGYGVKGGCLTTRTKLLMACKLCSKLNLTLRFLCVNPGVDVIL